MRLKEYSSVNIIADLAYPFESTWKSSDWPEEIACFPNVANNDVWGKIYLYLAAVLQDCAWDAKQLLQPLTNIHVYDYKCKVSFKCPECQKDIIFVKT